MKIGDVLKVDISTKIEKETIEDKSLLKVREWKEKCRRDAANLSDEEYIKRIRGTAERIMAKYHFKLKIANL